MIYVSDEPRYVVEFHPLDGLFPHVVLQLSRDDPPGERIRETTVHGKGATIYFEPSSAQPGIHSGHYIVVFPGGADQQGSYWVSVHERSQRSRGWNIGRLLKIARGLQSG